MRDYEPIGVKELATLGRRIDSEFVTAETESELYGKLNEEYPSDVWVMLRGPVCIGGLLVAFVVSPRID